MKNYLIVVAIFLMSYIISCGQSENTREVQNADTSTKLILTDTSVLANARLSPLDFFVKKYADSVNWISSSNNIPLFITNPQFDYDNMGVWSPSHHPLPLRFMIFEKVDNCNALKVLIQSNYRLYKLKPVIQNNMDVDHIKLSFYELALNRYKQLNCAP